MSNLFNLSKLLMESTNSSDIIQAVSERTYLSGGVDLLREMAETAMNDTEQMYMAVATAESSRDENKAFASYFKDYQTTVSKYILKVKELLGQFVVNVETFADANKDIIDIADGVNIVGTPLYKGVVYDKLLDPDMPHIDPQKAFKKEFAFIGKLLQDLDAGVGDDVRAQIIATVCNNLSNEISEDWIDKCIKKITGKDECTKDGFARTMYKIYVKEPSSEMDIDIGLVKQCKLSIANYITYINSVQKSVNDFCEGLEAVADYIGSMFYRNQDHRVEIKTDVEGIEDKTYHLGSCAMNQMNQFITTKISQITELCNLYIIAITIKMDCIYKYLQQCKDIVDTAYAGIDNTPNENSSDEDMSAEKPEDDESLGGGDSEEEDLDPDFYIDDENVSTDDPVEDDNSTDELEMECYLFEVETCQKNRLIADIIMKESIVNFVSEDATTGSDLKNKAKSVQAIMQNIIAQFGRVVEKFKGTFANYDKQVGYIKNNQDRIERANIPNGWTIQPLNMDNMVNFTVQPYSPADNTLLENKDKYLTTKYANIMGDNDGSIKDKILQKILEQKERPYTDADRKEGLDFILNKYTKCMTNIENANKVIQNAKSSAGPASTNTSVQKESFDLEQTLLMYFNEDGTPEPQGQDKQNNDKPATTNNDNKPKDSTDGDKNTPQPDAKQVSGEDAIRTYLTISTNLVTAVMNIYNMAMKKHLNFLRTLAKLNGAAPMNDNSNK